LWDVEGGVFRVDVCDRAYEKGKQFSFGSFGCTVLR